jgi:hypothetical protein
MQPSSEDPVARIDQARAELTEWAQILEHFRDELKQRGFGSKAAERPCATWFSETLFERRFDAEHFLDDAGDPLNRTPPQPHWVTESLWGAEFWRARTTGRSPRRWRRLRPSKSSKRSSARCTRERVRGGGRSGPASTARITMAGMDAGFGRRLGP